MLKRTIAIVLAGLLAGWMILWLIKPPGSSTVPSSSPVPAARPAASGEKVANVPGSAALPSINAGPPARTNNGRSPGTGDVRAGQSTPVGALEFTNLPPDAVMENLRLVFRSYQNALGGNPVGHNKEITHALNGGNFKQTRFLNEEDGMRLNANGELIDSWGTPFFFHQLSGTEMEIRSAGPDKVMWTGDDLLAR